jgi:hypothetical protein
LSKKNKLISKKIKKSGWRWRKQDIDVLFGHMDHILMVGVSLDITPSFQEGYRRYSKYPHIP